MFDRPLAMSLDGAVLTLTGAIDEFSVAALRERLAELVSSGRSLVVDLSEVDFLPSAGIGVLARARGALRRAGGDLTLVAAPGCPARATLTLAGLPPVTGAAGQITPEDVSDGPQAGSAGW